jgi:uncharacterized membrane protein YfcA
MLPMIMPAKVSTGYLLPLLIFGDIIAVLYWRQNALWNIVFKLVPWIFAGITAGFALMNIIPDNYYGHFLGGIVVVLFIFDFIRRYFHIPIPMGKPIITAFLGILAGIMTMMINAAGPVVIIYLLAMNISKENFIGTCAWTYFICNLVKVPFSYAQGLITLESLSLNLKFLPFVLLGGILGIIFMNKVPSRIFNVVTWLIAFLGGIRLFFS